MTFPVHWAERLNTERLRAFEELLEQPDPPELRSGLAKVPSPRDVLVMLWTGQNPALPPHGASRGARVTCPATADDRASNRRWLALVQRWCAYHRLEQQPEEAPARARRQPAPRFWCLARDGRL